MTEINKNKIDKTKLWDYFILVIRVWLAYTLIRYGWSKLIDGQFYITEATLNQPLKDIDLFRVSWFLAAHEPFNSFIGISQIITAALLLFNRTSIIGAFMSIPIWLNILMWDMTFIGLYTGFTIRLPYYLILTSFIIWHHKDKVFSALKSISTGVGTKYQFPIWSFLLLIPFGFLLELIGAIPLAIIHYIKQFFS